MSGDEWNINAVSNSSQWKEILELAEINSMVVRYANVRTIVEELALCSSFFVY